jgi:hypothetical protein
MSTAHILPSVLDLLSHDSRQSMQQVRWNKVEVSAALYKAAHNSNPMPLGFRVLG